MKGRILKNILESIFYLILATSAVYYMSAVTESILDLRVTAEQTGKDVETLKRSHAAMEYRQKVLKATPCGSCHWDGKLIINVPEWCDKHGGVK